MALDLFAALLATPQTGESGEDPRQSTILGWRQSGDKWRQAGDSPATGGDCRHLSPSCRHAESRASIGSSPDSPLSPLARRGSASGATHARLLAEYARAEAEASGVAYLRVRFPDGTSRDLGLCPPPADLDALRRAMGAVFVERITFAQAWPDAPATPTPSRKARP